MKMHSLAEELNRTLQGANPAVAGLLSETGRHLFFPSKGILAQSAEAKEKAGRFNATIGIATAGGEPMTMTGLHAAFGGLTAAEAFNYAPSFGLPALRKAWLERMTRVNPGLKGKPVSQPVVTGGITHGLSLVSDLFLGAGDALLVPDQMWEYRLIFETRRGATVETWPFFDDGELNTRGLEAALRDAAKKRAKSAVLLNFPNNPTGYSITAKKSAEVTRILTEAASAGHHLLVILDDAYTGLFYDEDVDRESLFSRLADAHENLLAVKLDGFTKEYFAWGMRTAFLTYGVKGGTPALYAALEQKTGGAVRAGVSNVSASGQAAGLKLLQNPAAPAEAEAHRRTLQGRALRVKQVLATGKYDDAFAAYPFNSGYFMLLRLKRHDAETFRRHALEKHGVGVIATAPTDVRVAFSCVEEERIPELFDLLLKTSGELDAGG